MLKVITLTGYKSFELGIYKNSDPAVQYIKKLLSRQIAQMADEGLEWVIISGQQGVELWAAEALFELREQYPEIKLAVITPFLQQAENWNEDNKQLYERVIAEADFVDSLSKLPYTAPWQFRNKNKFFLEKTEGALILYDEEKDGSPKYFYNSAREYENNHPYVIRTIDFYDLQAIVDEDNF